MKKRVLFILLACVPVFAMLAQGNVSSPSGEENEQGWGIVNLSVANLHEKADFASEMITQALMGMPVNCVESRNKVGGNSPLWHGV